MKRMHQAALTILLAAVAIGTTSFAQPEKGEAKKTIQIDGSTTVGPIAEAFAEAFMKMHPDVNVTVKKTGSGDGAAALIDGRCDIAAMSRFMKDTEFVKAVENKVFPVAHAIALDGVCVIVHPSNPVKNLTLAQIKGIFKGETTNWKDLGGPDKAIVAISRDTSSGTYETFNHFVMGKDKMAGTIETVNSNPQMQTRVKTTEGAIGYVGLGFGEEVKTLDVNYVSPNRKTIVSGKYPLSRPLFLFTNNYPAMGSLVYQFCTFHLTEKGQEIIEAKKFVPMTSY